MSNKFIVQAVKYGIVGVLNTLLTAVVIWLMMHWIFNLNATDHASSVAVSISNITGYIIGMINSFICNRLWTFQSKKNWKPELLKFIGAFLICYIPQLLLVMLLNKYAGLPAVRLDLWHHSYTFTSAYICQLFGIVFYTVLNFLCNKYYTFKKQS
jgi:putative flippase GtrA